MTFLLRQKEPMSVDAAVKQAAGQLLDQMTTPIDTAIILGSGLHLFANQIESARSIPFRDLPGFPNTTAFGHRGEFVIGTWQNHPLLALNGRIHLYEGHSVETITLPIRVCQAAGIQKLVISNASGGLNPNFSSGDVMLIEEHLDLTFKTSGAITELETNPELSHPLARSRRQIEGSIYCQRWCKSVRESAHAAGIPLQQGTYIGLTGPNYETRSEYRFLRKIGGDAVGMSTVWEASLAASLGMEVLGLSIITNVANPDQPAATSAQEVIDLAALAEQNLERLMHWILST